MPPKYTKVKSLILMKELSASGAPHLLTIGFRITDDSTDLWTGRFNEFKRGEERAVLAGVRTLSAALTGTENYDGIEPKVSARVVVVGAISSGDTELREGSPVWRLGSGIADAKGWEWRPNLLRKTPHRPLHTIYDAAERDAEVSDRYESTAVGGPAGIFVITDDFCTRGTTFADARRALRRASPGWKYLGLALAKTERRAYWGPELNNDHIPADLDAIWQGGRVR